MAFVLSGSYPFTKPHTEGSRALALTRFAARGAGTAQHSGLPGVLLFYSFVAGIW